MCLYPKLIKNRKYTVNKKNGGNVPTVTDERTKYVPIGCQNCIECRKMKSREWQARLLEDIKLNTNGKFITLTFNNQSIAELTQKIREEDKTIKGYDLDNAIATLAVKLFRERYRKQFGKSIRHWLVTELGHNGTENIHLHGIIWTDINLKTIENIWSYGFMWKGKEFRGKLINFVNERTIGYISKYVTKQDLHHKTYKPKILTSPGIGNGYTKNQTGDWNQNKFKGEQTNESYRTRTGHKIKLPIYWRNKIYSEKERELLWINMLNKEIRWVRGEKISIKNGYKDFDIIQEWHRKINKQLGYGTDQRNYEQEQYERERRILLQQTRLAKAHKNNNKKRQVTNHPAAVRE